MGVIVTEDVAQGSLFGPIPPSLTIADPILLIGHMTADNTPDLHTVKMNINRQPGVSGLVEWIPYVRAARDATEQNLEAILADSHLYYRSTRPIHSGQELLVWYTVELAKMVGVPEIHPAFMKGEIYTCPYCCKEFNFQYSLRAHMRFKCEKNPYLPKAKLNHSPPLKLSHPDSTASLKLFQNELTPNKESSKEKRGFLENNISPCTSGGSGSEQSPTSSPIASHSMTSSPPQEKRAIKRKLSDDGGSNDALNLVKRENIQGRRSSVEMVPANVLSSSPDKVIEQGGETVTMEQEAVSAFHKVEKSQSALSPNHTPVSLPVFGHPLMRPLISPAMPRGHNPSHLPGSFTPTFHNMHMNVAIRQASKENIPDIAISPLDTGIALKNREDLRNLMNCGKLPFHPDWRFQFPYIKSQNPIVENLLTSASHPSNFSIPLNVAQNWCAKCNATFRMTSDLVYHMRSHHKEEFQKTKAKPMEKLRCDTCGDRFKERHHLTRHMTSHQEV